MLGGSKQAKRGNKKKFSKTKKHVTNYIQLPKTEVIEKIAPIV